MPDYTLRIEFKVIEEYEFEVRAADEAKASKALLTYVKDISKIDPWKVRRFDVQETKILSVKETRLVQMERNSATVGEKKKRQRKSNSSK